METPDSDAIQPRQGRERYQPFPGVDQQRKNVTPTGAAPGYRIRQVRSLPPKGQVMDIVYVQDQGEVCVWDAERDQWRCFGPSKCFHDFHVDPDGSGTHETLFGATGAFTAAVEAARNDANGRNSRTIWVCPGWTELAAGPVTYTIPSSPQTVYITIVSTDHQSAVSSTTDITRYTIQATTVGQIMFRPSFNPLNLNVKFINIGIDGFGANNWEAIADDGALTSETGCQALHFDHCAFAMNGFINGVKYISKGTTSGSAGARDLSFDNCTGTIQSYSRRGTNSQDSGRYRFHQNNMQVTNLIEAASSTSSIPIMEWHDNELTVSGYGWRAIVLRGGQRFSNNKILHTGAFNFLESATGAVSQSQDDVIISDNIYIAQTVGARFFHGRGSGSNHRAYSIKGNVLHGPGSGKAMDIDTSIFTFLEIDNIYWNWDAIPVVNSVGAPLPDTGGTATPHTLLDGGAAHSDTDPVAPVKATLIVGDGLKWDGLPPDLNGMVLTLDSAQPLGAKWATPAGGADNTRQTYIGFGTVLPNGYSV